MGPMARAPPLYRLSRMLRRIGTIVLVAILLYVGAAAYSASQVRLAGLDGNGQVTTAGENVTVVGGISLQNGGFLGISGVELASYIWLPSGTLLGVAHSPTVTIPPGVNATVPVTLVFDLGLNAEAASLLTHNAELPVESFANVSFAGIATLGIHNSMNYSWGAPFQSLNVTPQVPTAQSNGTVAFPVRVSYQNAGLFDEVGTITYTVHAASGMVCATAQLPIDTPKGTGYDTTTTVYVPPSCSISGGTVDIDYTGNGLAIALPPEPIP